MKLLELIITNSAYAKEIGLTIIRVGIGMVFVWHGFRKVLFGPAELKWLGSTMANLGITFAPMFWGICAVVAEFLGGICLVFGFGTRVACAFMAFTMFVAVIHHITKGDTWGYISHPLALMVVFIGLMIAGSGIYSLDYYLSK